MFETLKNAWRIEDLRKKILYVLFLLLVFRVGVSFIPVAGVNAAYIAEQVDKYQVFGFLNLITGGSFAQFTIFALGISPYITASIVINLLTVAIPKLERLAKEGGEEGREKLQKITRYGSIVLALIEAVGITLGMKGALLDTSFFSYVTVALQLAAGTAIVMWMSDKITETGVANGTSLIIFIGIVSQIPAYVYQLITMIGAGALSAWVLVPVVLISVLIVAGVVFIDNGERKISVQYAKRVVGRKMYGGQSSNIPLKLNSSGVLPIIFAITLLQFPMMIAQFWPESGFTIWYTNFMGTGSIAFSILYAILIVAFSFFYASISFNPIEISKSIQQYGGFIPGIRPGKPTSDYLARIASRLTLAGGFWLALLATIPTAIMGIFGVSMALQATGVMICVSVALETSKSLEAQMLMRHYKGFLQ